MKALVYKGPRDVQIEEVPDATIEQPADVLVKINITRLHQKEQKWPPGPDGNWPAVIEGLHRNTLRKTGPSGQT